MGPLTKKQDETIMIVMVKVKNSKKDSSRRQFDCDKVLQIALKLFWRHGFEATSMADLLKATGLTAPSLYAAFGNKEELFLKAVDHYGKTYSVLLYKSLEEPIPAKAAIEKMLYEAADIFSKPEHPAGCFLVSGAVNCSPSSKYIEDELRKHRMDKEKGIADRLKVAQKKGELSPSADPVRLAKYFNTVMQGLSTQSQDGASKSELEDIVANAMMAWPEFKKAKKK